MARNPYYFACYSRDQQLVGQITDRNEGKRPHKGPFEVRDADGKMIGVYKSWHGAEFSFQYYPSRVVHVRSPVVPQ
jgi:hypothetical protein